MNELLQFINNRFKNDCNWTDGNCYYFAVILKDRFPEGKIFYDVIYGHFVYQYKNDFYDWHGLYRRTDSILINWDEFDQYDSLLKNRIIRDCIM